MEVSDARTWFSLAARTGFELIEADSDYVESDVAVAPIARRGPTASADENVNSVR
jgi:hypothetical protein